MRGGPSSACPRPGAPSASASARSRVTLSHQVPVRNPRPPPPTLGGRGRARVSPRGRRWDQLGQRPVRAREPERCSLGQSSGKAEGGTRGPRSRARPQRGLAGLTCASGVCTCLRWKLMFGFTVVRTSPGCSTMSGQGKVDSAGPLSRVGKRIRDLRPCLCLRGSSVGWLHLFWYYLISFLLFKIMFFLRKLQ